GPPAKTIPTRRMWSPLFFFVVKVPPIGRRIVPPADTGPKASLTAQFTHCREASISAEKNHAGAPTHQGEPPPAPGLGRGRRSAATPSKIRAAARDWNFPMLRGSAPIP